MDLLNAIIDMPALTLGLITEVFPQATSASDYYLGVYDIPISATLGYKEVVDSQHFPDMSAAFGKLEEEEQDACSIRVYLDEVGVNRAFQNRLKDHWYRFLRIRSDGNEYSTGFHAAMCLLGSGAGQNKWYLVEGVEFNRSRQSSTSSDLWESFGERSPIRTFADEVRQLLEDLREMLQRPPPVVTSIMRRLRFYEAPNGQFTVLISCKTMHPEQHQAAAARNNRDQESSFSSPAAKLALESLLRLEPVYRPIRTDENWKQIFLLQYQHANLNLFLRSLQEFENEYVPQRRRDFDARSSKLRRWVLREMATDASYYCLLSNIGNDLAETLESLMNVAMKTLPELQPSDFNTGTTFSRIETELRECCKEVRNRLARLNNEMDKNVKFLDLDRTLKQARNVERLTILATIFLPLSLAAGVLSMQSRFKDMGVLLYDFLGVSVLLGVFAVAVVVSLAFFNLIEEDVTKLFKANIFKRIWRLVLWYLALHILAIGLLILTSFTVGMFKNVVLGWLILGYGLVVAIGGPFVIGVLYSIGTVLSEYLPDRLR
ncbi:hypothetical protein ZTR_00488 [Talaromyces verruculosus]|nr:hypothetical protein ZTR_00488 [Talaromyces verruculosus]